jgi:hypothetical protein
VWRPRHRPRARRQRRVVSPPSFRILIKNLCLHPFETKIPEQLQNFISVPLPVIKELVLHKSFLSEETKVCYYCKQVFSLGKPVSWIFVFEETPHIHTCTHMLKEVGQHFSNVCKICVCSHIYQGIRIALALRNYNIPQEPILRLLNLQLQRQRCSRLERFYIGEK